jgi:DNA-binding response OmpR family regulator
MIHKKILILEDDPTMQMLLSKVLSLEGFQPSSPKNFSKACILETLNFDPPSMIILDVHLGENDGIELLKEIRMNHQYSPIKIIMTSGLDFRAECISAGADGFIMKPFIPSDLIDWLKQASGAEEQ